MVQTILHIGPPKTGTTTLQELVFSKMTGICHLGKPWWKPGIPYDKCVALHHAIDSITKTSPNFYDEAAARYAIDNWIEHSPSARAQPDGSLLPRLLSEERLMVTDVNSLEEIAVRLARLFPDAEIVLVKRDPVAALRSCHRWLYSRAWIDEGFTDWIGQGMQPDTECTASTCLRYYDWPEVDRIFGQHFPVVRFVDFDLMLSDIGGFLEAFFGFSSSAFNQFDWVKDNPVNESRNRAVSELHRFSKKTIRLWNRLPFADMDEKVEYLGESYIWRVLEAPLRNLRLGEAKLAVTAIDEKCIRAYYARRCGLLGPSNMSTSTPMNNVLDIGKNGR
jgi:hypothetical protein